jgi:hypothetical protein
VRLALAGCVVQHIGIEQREKDIDLDWIKRADLFIVRPWQLHTSTGIDRDQFGDRQIERHPQQSERIADAIGVERAIVMALMFLDDEGIDPLVDLRIGHLADAHPAD